MEAATVSAIAASVSATFSMIAAIVALVNARSTAKERQSDRERRETSSLLAVHGAVRELREVIHQGGVGRAEHRGARAQLLDALSQAPRPLPYTWELQECQGRPTTEQLDAALLELDAALRGPTPDRTDG